MNDLIAKLNKFKLHLEKNQDSIFVLSNDTDFEEIVEKLRTYEDVVNLAKMINDGLVPNTELYRIFKDFADNLPEEVAEEKILAESYERMEMDLNDYEYETTLNETFQEIMDNLDINYDNWETWQDCYDELGYEAPEMFINFGMNGWTDLADLLSEMDYGEDEELFYRKVLEGNLNLDELLTLTNEVVTYYEDTLESYDEESWEEEAEIEEDVDNLYKMNSAELDLLYSKKYMLGINVGAQIIDEATFEALKIELNDCKDNANRLMNFYTNLDKFHEEEEDKIFNEQNVVIGSNKESVKRKRENFDMIDQPLDEIRFEQRQTDLCLNPKAFKMLIYEINPDVMFTDEAIEALQTESEALMIEMFGEANENAIRAGRTHIDIPDMPSKYKNK